MGDEGSESNNSLSSTPPSMLEVLGEHLYAKVAGLQNTLARRLDVSKLTGVLLELGEKRVLQLLQDEEQLKQAVEQVIRHIPAVSISGRLETECGEDVGADLQEQLYSQVCRFEAALADHITGMLLELGSTQIRSLLESPGQLRQAIQHAKAAFIQHSPSHQHYSSIPHSMGSQTHQPLRHGGNCSVEDIQYSDFGVDCKESVDSEEMEAMGESVFAEAVKLYPEFAPKLTGMVLEMGQSRVGKLLQDTTQLHSVLHEAYTSLTLALNSS